MAILPFSVAELAAEARERARSDASRQRGSPDLMAPLDRDRGVPPLTPVSRRFSEGGPSSAAGSARPDSRVPIPDRSVRFFDSLLGGGEAALSFMSAESVPVADFVLGASLPTDLLLSRWAHASAEVGTPLVAPILRYSLELLTSQPFCQAHVYSVLLRERLSKAERDRERAERDRERAEQDRDRAEQELANVARELAQVQESLRKAEEDLSLSTALIETAAVAEFKESPEFRTLMLQSAHSGVDLGFENALFQVTCRHPEIFVGDLVFDGSTLRAPGREISPPPAGGPDPVPAATPEAPMTADSPPSVIVGGMELVPVRSPSRKIVCGLRAESPSSRKGKRHAGSEGHLKGRKRTR